MGRSMGTPIYYNLTGVKVFTICPTYTNTQLFDGMKLLPGFEDLADECQVWFALEPQKPEFVGECLIKIINDGENGSVWMINKGTEMEKVVDARPVIRKNNFYNK